MISHSNKDKAIAAAVEAWREDGRFTLLSRYRAGIATARAIEAAGELTVTEIATQSGRAVQTVSEGHVVACLLKCLYGDEAEAFILDHPLLYWTHLREARRLMYNAPTTARGLALARRLIVSVAEGHPLYEWSLIAAPLSVDATRRLRGELEARYLGAAPPPPASDYKLVGDSRSLMMSLPRLLSRLTGGNASRRIEVKIRLVE